MTEQAQRTTVFVTLEAETCYKCGIAFGLSSALMKYLKDHKGTTFYCPAGHPQHYIGETEEDRLRRQVEQEKKRTEWAKQEARNIELQRRAAVGQLTKLKNRVGEGVCPCCNRTFQNLMRHMNTKHPYFAALEARKAK